MLGNEKVSVILPTYNERDNVVSLIMAIHALLNDVEHEIIVVDDNSSDGTCKAVVDIGLPQVKAILRTKDHGLAHSIRCGLESASGNCYVVMDSDWQHDPEYVPIMIRGLSDYDCVVGSRFIYGGRMRNPWRHILSRIFNLFTRVMTGGQITDSLYGFFAVRKSTIEKCNYDDIFWGYGDYCIRMLYYLQKGGTSILQIPVIGGIRQYGKAHERYFQVFWQYFVAVLQLVIKRRLRLNVFYSFILGKVRGFYDRG